MALTSRGVPVLLLQLALLMSSMASLHEKPHSVLQILPGGELSPIRTLPARSPVRRQASIVEPREDALTRMLTYYINLDNSTYRHGRMDAALAGAGIRATRFSAVSADNISSGTFDAKYVAAQGLDKGRLLRFKQEGTLEAALNSTVACFVSHVEVLEKLGHELRPSQLGLVLEDDLDIPTHWRREVLSMLQSAPAGWDLLKLSGWGATRECDRVAALPSGVHETSRFYRVRGPFREQHEIYYGGSAAYLVRGSSIPRVLAHLRGRPITDYDEMLLARNGSELHAYEVHPHPFDLAPRALFSQIRPNGISEHGRWLLRELRSLSRTVASMLGGLY